MRLLFLATTAASCASSHVSHTNQADDLSCQETGLHDQSYMRSQSVGQSDWWSKSRKKEEEGRRRKKRITGGQKIGKGAKRRVGDQVISSSSHRLMMDVKQMT